MSPKIHLTVWFFRLANSNIANILQVLVASKITSSYRSFIDTIFSYELQNDVESKPLLNVRFLAGA